MDDARSNKTKSIYKIARALAVLCMLLVALCVFVVAIFVFSAAMDYLTVRNLYRQPFNVTKLLANNVGDKKVSLNVMLGADTVCILGGGPIKHVLGEYFQNKSVSRLDDYRDSYLGSDDPRWVILATNDGESDVRILEVWENNRIGDGVEEPAVHRATCSRNLIVSMTKDADNLVHMNIE